VSAARKRRKLSKSHLTWENPYTGEKQYTSGKGAVFAARFDRLWNKRKLSDPSYLTGRSLANAPVKYSRCPTCAGAPHHPPSFFMAR
jgi:hypothetical protein